MECNNLNRSKKIKENKNENSEYSNTSIVNLFGMEKISTSLNNKEKLKTRRTLSYNGKLNQRVLKSSTGTKSERNFFDFSKNSNISKIIRFRNKSDYINSNQLSERKYRPASSYVSIIKTERNNNLENNGNYYIDERLNQSRKKIKNKISGFINRINMFDIPIEDIDDESNEFKPKTKKNIKTHKLKKKYGAKKKKLMIRKLKKSNRLDYGSKIFIYFST